MAQRFSIPKAVWIGKNALKEAAKDICSLGHNALIVCGKSMICQGYMDTLTDILDANEVAWHIYSDVSGEPTVQIVEMKTWKTLLSACNNVYTVVNIRKFFYKYHSQSPNYLLPKTAISNKRHDSKSCKYLFYII